MVAFLITHRTWIQSIRDVCVCVCFGCSHEFTRSVPVSKTCWIVKTEMSVKHFGLLLVMSCFIATVALLYKFVMNAVCMLCLVCNAFCFCVDLWCGISFSAYKNTFRDVCLRRCAKKDKVLASTWVFETVSAGKFETQEVQVPIPPRREKQRRTTVKQKILGID